jgi:hypothetical protein
MAHIVDFPRCTKTDAFGGIAAEPSAKIKWRSDPVVFLRDCRTLDLIDPDTANDE